MSSELRKHVLAEEAFKRRLVWLMAGWQSSPASISKADVIEYIKTKPVADQPQLTPCLLSLRRTAGHICEFLADLHRDDADLPVVALDTAWPANETAADALDKGADAHAAAIDASVNASHAALPAFLELLRRHDAADVVDKIRVFVRGFVTKDWRGIYSVLPDEDAAEYADDEELEGMGSSELELGSPSKSRNATVVGAPRAPAAELRRFLTELENHMAEHALWRSEVGTPAWEVTLEVLEKFVCSKTYSAVFGVHPRAAQRDAALNRRLRSLAFVSFKHLDIPEPPSFLIEGWAMAADALSAMDRFENPSDKMACILNACRVVSTLLALSTDARGGARDSGVGADEFLPALIYVVLQSSPPRLYSNLRYIAEFCHPNKMNSEAGYFYTNVYSAVSFARNVKPEHLSLSAHDFEASVRSALDTAERRTAQRHRLSLASPPRDQSCVPAEASDARAVTAPSVEASEPEERGQESSDVDLLVASHAMLVRLRDVLGSSCDFDEGAHDFSMPSTAVPATIPPQPLADSLRVIEFDAAAALKSYKQVGTEVIALLQLLGIERPA